MGKKRKQAETIGGPFLAAAVFCESILDETDRSVSAIRIHDGTAISIHHDAPPDVPSEEHPIALVKRFLLVFKSGDAPGKHRLQIVANGPSGKRTEMIDREIELSDAPAGGLNIKNEAKMGLHLPGVYWFDILLNGKLLTRMPFNITITREPAPVVEAEEGPKKEERPPRKKASKT